MSADKSLSNVESGLGEVDLGNLSGAEDIGELKNVILAQEAEVKLSGMWTVVVSILKTMVGAGILGLPSAFLAGGWLFSIFVFPVIALLTGYCMVALIRSKEAAHLSRTASPADVGESAYGAVGRILVAIILCLDSFGVCLSYFIFITYNMFLMTNVRQEAWAVIFFFFFLIISYIRPVKFISYITLVACFLTLIGLIITLVAVFVAADRIGEPRLFNWKDFPLFIGIVLFAFQAINIAMPAYNSLRNPARFTLSVIIVLSIGLVAYLAFGLTVYLRISDNAEGGMLTEIITNRPIQIIVCVLFVISLCANMVCWIYAIYEVSDRLSCANKLYIMSPAERRRLLAENEGAAAGAGLETAASPVPGVANPSPAASPVAVASPIPPNSPPEAAAVAAAPAATAEVTEVTEVAVVAADQSEDGTQHEAVEDVGGVTDEKTSSEQSEAATSAPTTESSSSLVRSGSAASSVERVQPVGEPVVEEEEPGIVKKILINWKFWVLSTIGRIVVLLIIMIPSVTPARDHFNSFMGLSGCLTGVLMSFIMPMFAQLKLQWKTMPLWQKILDIVILVVSIPGMIYVTVITIIDLVNSLKEEA